MIALMASVAAASLVGSLHCIGMCGPFATLAAARPRRVRLPLHAASASAAAYHGGRLVVYLALGTAAGSLGAALQTTGSWVGVQRLATAIAGGSMVLVGLVGLLGAAGFGGLRLSTGLGARATRLASRALHTAAQVRPRHRAALLGAATGLMPCGWLWAFVLTAAATANPLTGAATMFAFWVGNLPALLAVALGAQHLGQRLRPHLRWLMPLLVAAIGVFTLTSRLDVALPVGTATTPDPAAVHVPETAPCH